MAGDFGASKRGGAGDARERPEEWSVGGAPNDYDALADLFLGDEDQSTLNLPGRGKPVAESAARTGRRVAPESASKSPDPAAETPTSIEALVLGHLPVRAGPWVSQYARVIASGRKSPVALVRAVADEVSVELVGASKARLSMEGAPFESLDSALARIADVTSHWIVQVDELNEPALTQDPHVTDITLLAGANEAAIVAAYRTIKSLASSFDGQTSDRAHASVRISIMGAAEDEANAAMAKLRQAASTYLNVPIERSALVPRMEPCSTLSIFRGPMQISHEQLLAEIESFAAGDHAAAPIPFAVTREQPRPQPQPSVLEPIDFTEEELRELASPQSVPEVPKPAAPNRGHEWPELSTQVAELKPFKARCPDDDSVELAIDADGRLHLLRMDHDGRAVDSLVAVTAWAKKHRNLLSMAAPPGRLNGAAHPIQHLFTTKPKNVRHLLDADAKVHLLAPVTIAGQRGWYCTELN